MSQESVAARIQREHQWSPPPILRCGTFAGLHLAHPLVGRVDTANSKCYRWGDCGGSDDDCDDYFGEADVENSQAEQIENGAADVKCFSSTRPFPPGALNLVKDRRFPEGADVAVCVGLTELVEGRSWRPLRQNMFDLDLVAAPIDGVC